ncbi:flagellar brake domain-containing protein [Metabacillus sp. GX 13764]|uniref:flagellar brake protein n=1 Tax=Metabacillus kandeliae TaxID=2900151 RepID=UPI001E3D7DC0|nr:flagellar brake domain-containing protein [Metabacillus kandeliae]MCD7033346.1 flagellar brake domain-containing protein [Metabacillus kandeliae]
MINIGDVLLLEDIETLEKYRCKAVEITEEYLLIDYPINEKTGKTAFIMNGAEFSASFTGKDQNAYVFKTKAQGRRKENIPMIVLALPAKEDYTKIQRRQYVRIETGINAAVHPSQSGDFHPFTALTIDISAGGAALRFPEDSGVLEGSEIGIWLSLPFQNAANEYVKIKAKVIRVLDGKPGWKKGIIEFHHLSEHSRQLIMRFCFDQQILLRKKGIYSE